VRGLLLIIIISFLFLSNAFGQTVQVLNAKTGKPVEGVLLFSEKNSTQTNQNGNAKLDSFAESERIEFKHSSFLQFVSTKQKIEKKGGIVLLIEDPVRLDEIIVSVNRWEQSKTEIPHTIKTIDTEEIRKYNPQTTADLLGNEGAVFIQKSQMGGGSPMIRGFAANRVLIVVDGIRMNNAIYRSGNLHNVISVDANSLENTEIIFGPGSVIYGSDALGGVMSFNTLTPKLSTTDEVEHSGKVFSRISTATFEKTGHASYNFGSKKWAGVFNTTFSDFDDLKMGNNGSDQYLRNEYVSPGKTGSEDKIINNENPLLQKFTGYNQFNISGKIRFRPNEKFDFQLSAHHSQTGEIPRYDRLIQERNNQLRYAEWFYGPQKWTLISGRFQYQKEHVLFNKLNLLVGYQKYRESRNDRSLFNDWLRSRTENLNIYSANLDFGKSFDKKNELFYGMEAYYNKIGSTGKSTHLENNTQKEIASRYPDGSTYGSIAGYYSFKYNLNKQVIFQFGSRFTYTKIKGQFDERFYDFPFSGFDLNNSAFNGNVGIVWHPTEDWQINVHMSTGFRAPNIDDVAKVFDSEPGKVVVPNPDLKPEYARNLELNVIRSYATKARIELTGFYTWLKNAMVRRDYSLSGQDSIFYDGVLSKVEALVNAESATIWGANFSFEYLFSNEIRTRNDLTLTSGKDAEGLPLRHVPPTFGSSHIIFENQRLFFDLYTNYSGKFDFEQLAPDEQDKPHLYLADEKGNPYSPGWWTLNLKSNYKFRNNLILGGGIENILNKRYRPYSSGVVSPGINFIISATINY